MSTIYFYYLYSYVVGVCGHLPTFMSYVEAIHNAMKAAAEHICYTIYLSPNDLDSYIHHPVSPLHFQDKRLIQLGRICYILTRKSDLLHT